MRSSMANLRCKDGLINLARGGAAPDDLHLRRAALTKTGAALAKTRNPEMAIWMYLGGL